MKGEQNDGDRLRNEKSGRYIEEFPTEAFLDALNAIGVAGTGEVSEQVRCSHELAYKRLQTLENEGQVTSRLVGQTRLWRRV